MSVTIIECLMNANHNLQSPLAPALMPMIKEQLNNATTLLEKGYEPDDVVDAIIEEFGSIEEVPYKDEENE